MTEAVLVTSENADAFYAKRLNLAPEPAAAAPASEPAKAAADEGKQPAVESAKVETPASAPDEADDKQIPNAEARQRVNMRFSELAEARKTAEAEATKAKAEAKAANDARMLAETRAAELQTKYEPPKPDELGPEPQLSQFSDPEEWGKALREHTAEKAVRDLREGERRGAIEKAWDQRYAATAAELPGFAETIAASAELRVSNEVRDAIVESEVGPKILHYLASNPVVVGELAKMKTGPAMLQIGRIEARFLNPAPASTAPAPASKETPAPAKPAPVAASEPSRAPAPISPLKGASSPADVPIAADGAFYGTHAQYQAARKAGKI